MYNKYIIMSDNKEIKVKKPRKVKNVLSIPEMIEQLKTMIKDNEEEIKVMLEEIEEIKKENQEAFDQIVELEKLKDTPPQEKKTKTVKKQVSHAATTTTLNFD